ncbi:MAG: BrnA antitoxin family protein [Chloroflexota bacterium]
MKKEYDFSDGKRGAIDPTPPGKTRITIRLDNDIIDWFRNQVELAGGGNYQTLINQVLCEHIQNRQVSLEETLRRIIREELSNSSATEVVAA